MARQVEKLLALAVSRASKPGLYADGGGLYLQITPTGAKSWTYRFMLGGKARAMGLGPLHVINLAEARAKATQCRRLRLEGIDPINARQAERDRAKLEAASSITFKECAAAYIKAHRAGRRNAKHADQWANTIATYAEPVFGSLPVQGIDTGLVMRALEPIWATKSETAGRLRGRIESILDWATVRGYRKGENPARWRGHLDMLLPQRSKVAHVEHHAALPYSEIGAFIATLHEQQGVAAQALEFAILTAARTGEVIGSTWNEIDLKAATWTIPAKRMKGGREHRVPLSPAAMAVLKVRHEERKGEYVFPGQGKGQPLSNMALLMTLRRMNRDDFTVHGFRSTFRDWAAEMTSYQGEVVEMALARTVGDKVEAAYRRGDLFEKRRRLMDAWAGNCAAAATPNVVPIRRTEA